MYTVTIKRPAAPSRTRPAPATHLQHATTEDFAAAHNGTLWAGAMSWTIYRCKTRPGAWWKACRALLSGPKADVAKGDPYRGALPQFGRFS